MFKCYESPVSTLTCKDSNFRTPYTRKVIHERKSHFENPAKHLRWRYNRLSLLTLKNRRESWTLSKQLYAKGSILEVGQGSEFAFAQHNKQIPNQRQQ